MNALLNLPALGALVALLACVNSLEAATTTAGSVAHGSATAPRIEINPQPLPPRTQPSVSTQINPQPLPPRAGAIPLLRPLPICPPPSARICIGGVCRCD